MAEPRRVLVVGGGDLAGEVCEALEAGGGEVTWLEHADDETVREGLERARPDLVCVATRDDAFPLRIALLVRHLDAGRAIARDDLRPGDLRADRRHDPQLHGHLARRHRRADPRRAVRRPGPDRGAPQARARLRRRRAAGGGRPAAAAAAPRAQLRDRGAPALRPQRRAADLWLRRARADARLRAVRCDDRARPAVRRRVLRLDEVARHRRPEHRRRRRAEVVQGRDRLLGDPHPACRPRPSPAA